MSYDYTAIHDEIYPLEKLKYPLDDGGKVEVVFEKVDINETKVVEIFEPDPEHPAQIQRDSWYAIRDNFCKQVENN